MNIHQSQPRAAFDQWTPCLAYQNRFMATKIVLLESREASIAETAHQEGRSEAQ